MLQPRRCAAAAPQLPPPLLDRLHARPRRSRRALARASAQDATAAAVARAAAAVRSAPEAALVLSLDVGTTGVKAAAVARSGRLVASASAGYARATRTSAQGRAEQAPADWLHAAGDAATRCLAALPPGAAVAAVALCGQMQTLTLVGRSPGALARRDAILYSDARAAAQAADVDAALAAAPGLASTNLVGAGGASVPAKLLWLAEHEPAALRAARAALLGAHSAVAWALTGGAAAADATSASASGVLAPGGAAYAAAALERLGIDASMLPPLLPPDAPAGVVTVCSGRLTYADADADLSCGVEAKSNGFSFPAELQGLPVFHGAGDVAATAAGAGGGTHLYLGTSGWAARDAADDGAPPPRGVFQLAAPLPGRVIRAAAATTAGGAVEWARAAFFGGAPASEVSAAAARSAPGARGVIFLPHLAGERSPFRDDAARGALLGLGGATCRDDVARAVLEGTALHARALLDALNSGGDESSGSSYDSEPLVVVGGGAQSAVWLGILADVLQRPLRAPPGAAFAACRGAAGWAFSGLGAWGPAAPPPRDFHVGGDGGGVVAAPDAGRAALYDELYDAWRAAHPALAAAGLQGGAASRAAWRAGRA